MIDLESRRSFISIRIQMLISLFGKKTSDDTLEAIKRVFCDVLENFPQRVITKVFTRAERECERFPTPRQLAILASEEMPGNAWRYNFTKAKRLDPENVMFIDVLIDPDPLCQTCRIAKSEHKKQSHSYQGDEVMYRPQDCPEGRAFLAKLKEISQQ